MNGKKVCLRIRLIVVQEIRKTSKFMQYAIYAAGEALRDAGWQPRTEEEHENTVSVLCIMLGGRSLAHRCTRASA